MNQHVTHLALEVALTKSLAEAVAESAIDPRERASDSYSFRHGECQKVCFHGVGRRRFDVEAHGKNTSCSAAQAMYPNTDDRSIG